MLWVHPILQALTTLIAVYVLWLGLKRLAASHFGAQTQFNWKRHVSLGKLVMLLWTAGLIGGLVVTRLNWSTNGITGIHFSSGLLLLPLIVFGYLTGRAMDKNKKRRTLLPLLHGICNIILFLGVLWQALTGYGLVLTFLLSSY